MRGRIRSIKPEALSDEDLWDLEVESGFPMYRAYTGLWMYADREGRFEWKPRTLKPFILPHWDGDFAAVLDAFERAGFVVRYEVDGRTYGWVRTFHKHQTPNAREPASQIPAPPTADARTCVHVHDVDASGARTEKKVSSGNGKGMGREGNGSGNVAHPPEGLVPANQQGAPPELDPDRFERTRRAFRQEFARRFHEADPQSGLWSQGTTPEVDKLTQWLLTLPIDPLEAMRRTFDTFFADPYCRSIHFSIAHLAKCHLKYFEPRAAPAKTRPPETIESLRSQAREASMRGDTEGTRALTKRIEEIQDQAERDRQRGNRARA